jgi:hypothetical protein
MEQPGTIETAERDFSLRVSLGLLAAVLLGGLITPRVKRLSALMADRGPADPEVKSLLRKITLAARIDVAFLLLIVIDMTVKPFS